MSAATQYISSHDLVKHLISHIIEEFSEQLRNVSGKCMDIGCGPGNITKEILMPVVAPNTLIIGTDIMECMITYANREYGDKGRLEFETLDIQTKNLPKKYISEFDHIFSFHALHWCDIRQSLKNIYQMLKPGGTTLLVIITYHIVFDCLKVLAQDIRYTSYLQDMHKFFWWSDDSKKLRNATNLLKSIGFEVHHCSHRERTYSAHYLTDFLNAIVGFLEEFLDKIPHNLREQFYNEFRCEYKRRTGQCGKDKDKIMLDLHEVTIIYAKKTERQDTCE